MKPEDQVISIDEYTDYLKGKKVEKIEEIWKRLIADLPENLKKEAVVKGYRLAEQSKLTSYINLLIEIPNASEKLSKALLGTYPFIICLID